MNDERWKGEPLPKQSIQSWPKQGEEKKRKGKKKKKENLSVALLLLAPLHKWGITAKSSQEMWRTTQPRLPALPLPAADWGRPVTSVSCIFLLWHSEWVEITLLSAQHSAGHLGIPQSILAIIISGGRTYFKVNQQLLHGRCWFVFLHLHWDTGKSW